MHFFDELAAYFLIFQLLHRQESNSLLRPRLYQPLRHILILHYDIPHGAANDLLQREGVSFRVFYAEKGANAAVDLL